MHIDISGLAGIVYIFRGPVQAAFRTELTVATTCTVSPFAAIQPVQVEGTKHPE